MSKLSKHSVKSTADHKSFQNKAVQNFDGGTSYILNPLDTLRIVAASSIFGEPSYYRGSHDKPSNLSYLSKHDILGVYTDPSETTTDVFTKAIDAALEFDFKATLELAKKLRNEYFMRLNPAVIFIRASQHPKRVEFNEANPGMMKQFGMDIVGRPDDITNQFDYFMFLKGSKNGLPSIVKRTWAERLATFNRYQINKYKSKSLIDLVRISHAHSEVIDELMKTGDIKVGETEQTWESLKSQGKTWKEILDTIKVPHMALLRNLRNIFTEINDTEIAKKVLTDLKAGVLYGKQFPFRYYTAYKEIDKVTINHKGLILDSLQECLDISVDNFPKLKGKVACLSDNSGSSWGAMTSEYGSTQIAEIANLSSIITALASDEGYVGVFGDKLSLKPVSKRDGILSQLEETCKIGKAQGGGTENGIWLFLDEAIKTKTHYDTIFIYSDMQAGHGGLFGINPSEYSDYMYEGGRHIDVLKLVQEYRRKVNPKVNVFTTQVGGYNNSVVPENLYRGAILAGWTGKETLYASELISTWDDIENKVETPVVEETVQA
jgi:hypothetical protein